MSPWEIIAIILGSSGIAVLVERLFDLAKNRASTDKIRSEADAVDSEREWNSHRALVESAESLTNSTKILNQIYRDRLMDTKSELGELNSDYLLLEDAHRETNELYQQLLVDYQEHLRELEKTKEENLALRKEQEKLRTKISELRAAIEERDRIIQELQDKLEDERNCNGKKNT